MTTSSAVVDVELDPIINEIGPHVCGLRIGRIERKDEFESAHTTVLLFEVDKGECTVRHFGACHVLQIDAAHIRGHIVALVFFGDTLRDANIKRASDCTAVGIARFSMAIVCAQLQDLSCLTDKINQLARLSGGIIRKSLRDASSQIPHRRCLFVNTCDHAEFLARYGIEVGTSVLSEESVLQCKKDSVACRWKLSVFGPATTRLLDKHDYAALHGDSDTPS